MKRSLTPKARALTLLVSIALLVPALAGCSRGGSEYTTITEKTGMFHLNIRSDWSGRSDDGLIAVVASEEVPTEVETIDRFWLLVYPSVDSSDTPVAEELPLLVEARAEARQWQDYELGPVRDTEVGSRKAVMLTASGANLEGVAFDARYYLIRTQGTNVIIAAIAPAGSLGEYAEELDELLAQRWFWHGAVDDSAETSVTGTP